MENQTTALQNVLVTGSTRGLGHAIARKFAQSGYKVAIAGRDEGRSKQVAEALAKEFSATVIPTWGDVGTESGTQTVFEQAQTALGNIHILINNAGITRDKLLLRMNETDWNTVLETNLTSMFYFARAALKTMLKQRNGRIINIASVVGQTGNPGQTNYAASKGGMIAFTKALAREVASKNITVNAIAPGFIATDMTDALETNAQEKLLQSIPLGRLGTPKEIAAAAYFLASSDAGYITGHTLSINGGMFM